MYIHWNHVCTRAIVAVDNQERVWLRIGLPETGVLQVEIKLKSYVKAGRRHQIETFSALLAICAGNSPVPGEFPTQRPVTRSFDVFFDLRLNKRLSKQSWGWWFETLSRPLWRHRNEGMCKGERLIMYCDNWLWSCSHNSIHGTVGCRNFRHRYISKRGLDNLYLLPYSHAHRETPFTYMD